MNPEPATTQPQTSGGLAPAGAPSSTAPILTVIVPAYNEAPTLDQILRRIVEVPLPLQVIVINDGSTDDTEAVLAPWRAHAGVEIIEHSANRGKGSAIRTALALARGRFTVVQDADLEYDPRDYARLLEAANNGTAAAVFGSRYLARRGNGWRGHRAIYRGGVDLLNAVARALYKVRLTDQATGLKLLPTHLQRAMQLECARFEFCAEVTAKLCRMSVPIVEVPISYVPRTRRQGKKLRWTDGIQALWTLWRWRQWLPGKTGANTPPLF